MHPRESDVSVLIPSYRRPEMTLKAIRCALGTGAGEVIVSDDASNDGTVDRIRTVSDSRLRAVVQSQNLGLWPNHRALLLMATRPFVKFLQNDDEIAPGGLSTMVGALRPHTTVVSAHPVVQNLEGERYSPRNWPVPLYWSSDEYLDRMCLVGNELGSPSDVLWRRDCLDLSEEAWRNEISSDLIMNVRCASRGEVALVPAGPIITTHHPGRDMNRQSSLLITKRNLNTLEYLVRDSDPRVRRVVPFLGVPLAVMSLLATLASVRRWELLSREHWRELLRLWRLVVSEADYRALRLAPRLTRYVIMARSGSWTWTPQGWWTRSQPWETR
jgi:glycosyltransferase involved in cell wall biosynthesis